MMWTNAKGVRIVRRHGNITQQQAAAYTFWASGMWASGFWATGFWK